MLQPDQWISFLAAGTLGVLSPGPDILMVLSLSTACGRKHGMSFGLGSAVGCLCHTALAVLGLGALLATSPKAYIGLRVAGAAYLVGLGIQLWTAPRGHGAEGGAGHGATDCRLTARFLGGVVATVINPKVMVFFVAFLPQFADADATAATLAFQTAQLGVAYAFLTAVIFCVVGHYSSAVGDWLHARPRSTTVLNRCAGALFIALGALLWV